MSVLATARGRIALAALGSALLLGAAFFFQALGFLPCAMCLWQRWPHVAAMALGLIGVVAPVVPVAILGALSMVGNAGLGVYHTGVERGWFEGPQACAARGEDLGALTGADLLAVETAPPVVLCNEVSWQMLGLSMASYNAIFSAALAGLWLTAAMRARRA